METKKRSNKKLKFVDLFCGIGGFHVSLSNLGHKCVWACDIDSPCCDIYEKNFGMEPVEDITKVNIKDIPNHDVLCAGFPCQSFSHAGKQRGFEDKVRGTLFSKIIEILKVKSPNYFILENVKNLQSHDKGNTWSVIYNALTSLGYNTFDKPIIMSPLHIGVPQNRDRVFIIGVKNGKGELPQYPTFMKQQTSIYDITDDDNTTPTINSDVMRILNKWEEFIQHFKALDVKMPSFPIWTDYFVDDHDVDQYPDWKKKFIEQNMEFYEEHKQFIERWLQEAQSLDGFVNSKTKLEWQCGKFRRDDSLWNLLFQFRPSGIRVKRSNYSPALVAMNQIVNVGKYKRKLTPREVARLQSFPEDFIIDENDNRAYKQFGNSVNVRVVTEIAKLLLT